MNVQIFYIYNYLIRKISIPISDIGKIILTLIIISKKSNLTLPFHIT